MNYEDVIEYLYSLYCNHKEELTAVLKSQNEREASKICPRFDEITGQQAKPTSFRRGM